jgi:hypothetical protein
MAPLISVQLPMKLVSILQMFTPMITSKQTPLQHQTLYFGGWNQVGLTVFFIKVKFHISRIAHFV